MYEETTQPHVKSEELHDRLEALDNRIDRVEEWIEGKEENENDNHWLENLNGAKTARDKAWIQWDSYNFSKAEDNKTIAHDLLSQIPITIKPTSETPLICIIIIIVIIALILLVIVLFYIKKDNQ